MPSSLTPDQISRYEREGVFTPIRVLAPAEVERYLAAFEELVARLGGSPKAVELSLTHLFFAWSYELVTHPKVLDAVEGVLGPNILVWSSSWFPKKPHDPGYISFHQDGTYWGLDSTQVTTAWIALTPSTPENGCMRVVPRTHAGRIYPHTETHAADNLLSRGQVVEYDIDERDVLDVVLKPGEMSLHHVNLIHGSNPNGSDGKRVGFAVRYMTPRVRQISEKHPVVLARGRDDYHYHDLLTEPPAPADLDEAIARHAEAAAKHLEAVTKTEAAR